MLKFESLEEFLEKVSKPSVIPDEPTIIKDAYDILTSDKEPSKIDKQLLQEKKSLETRLKDMELNLTNLKDRIRNASIKVKQADIDKYKAMDIDVINETADKLISSITNHLADYKIQPGHLNLMARSMLNKELDAMDLSDWQKFDNMFKEMRNPSFLQRMRGLVKDKSPLLSKAHYFMFPEHIDKDLLSKNIDFFNEKTLYFDKDGKPFEYNGHFSWVYALNNTNEIDGVKMFEWLAEKNY